MVPHVNRQEMYTGQEFVIKDSARKTYRRYSADKNESPINLFNPDFSKYPNFRFITNQYSQVLQAGDCAFVPAYYFY